MKYPKAAPYDDYQTIYQECSGPGGLELAEYLAHKMKIEEGSTLVDIGTYRGYQTCFLSKEYALSTVGIDPWDDRFLGIPHIDLVMKNAVTFGIEKKLIAIKTGVPETALPSNCFDFAYCTTTLEMVRGFVSEQAYFESLKEILRILKPGGVLGLAEPMHFDTELPADLAPYAERNNWNECFASLNETVAPIQEAGFTILESDYCEDADKWWKEFIQYSPDIDANPEDTYIVENNEGRWLSFGYVIARKPR